MTEVCCCFLAPGTQPCPAFADNRSSHHYCYAHEEIYLHDAAVTFRRIRRKNKETAEQWARTNRLSVDRMHEIADALSLYEKPFLLKVL